MSSYSNVQALLALLGDKSDRVLEHISDPNLQLKLRQIKGITPQDPQQLNDFIFEALEKITQIQEQAPQPIPEEPGAIDPLPEPAKDQSKLSDMLAEESVYMTAFLCHYLPADKAALLMESLPVGIRKKMNDITVEEHPFAEKLIQELSSRLFD